MKMMTYTNTKIDIVEKTIRQKKKKKKKEKKVEE